jgi:hypothetical protein
MKVTAKFLQTLHQYPIEKAKAFDVPYDQMNRLGIKARKEKLEENVMRAIDNGLFKNTEAILEYLRHLNCLTSIGFCLVRLSVIPHFHL